MNEIKCPECGCVFKVDESGYANLIKQVRDNEFEKDLKIRRELMEKEKLDAVKLAEATTKNDISKELSKKDIEIVNLQKELEILKKDNEKEIIKAISDLKIEKELLLNEIKVKEVEQENIEKTLKEKYTQELKNKDEQIEHYKDMKAKLSTKMVGETLEKHCEHEFERLRSTAFRNVEFIKDSKAEDHTKGDYIYREYDDEGNELISIMFEMKNQNETTTNKRKNDEFLKKLDEDRTKKGCEYAILVSMLEMDNELYNSGIVDKEHVYKKMYVIRPQFFIPIISILRNAAMNSLQYKSELALVKAQEVDISKFEENIEEFKEKFASNYNRANKKFDDAIKEIDKTIENLEKVKGYLLNSGNQLRLANDKAENLTIKKLRRNNPTMTKMFEDIKKDD